MSRIPPLPCLHPGVVLAAALAAGCVPSTTTPAADPGTQQPTFGAGDMPPGTHVQVAKQGQWFGATIVQPLGEGRFLVHYDNTTGSAWDEAVGPDRIKSQGPAPGAGPAHDYRPGEKVLVTYQSRLLLADVVMNATPDTWRVHYDGFGPEASEVVGPERMRRPYTGPSGHVPGENIQVEVNGQVVAGKVLAASAADRWVVRFETYGPQYDKEVGIDQIRAATTVAPHPAEPKTDKPAEKPAEKAAEKPAEKTTDKGDKKAAEKPAEKAAVEKPAEKPKPKPLDAPAPPSGPPSVGENVLVNVRGAWFAAAVTAVGTGTFKVKFAAAGGGEEEVAADRILREPTTKGMPYQPGQLVVVDYKGVFVPAKVLRQEAKGEYKVRFDGQGPEADEVIAVKRLRPR